MKKIFFLLILFSSFVQAQIVNIPDANFKNALLSYNPVIDTNLDGEIQESEALAVNYLILEGLEISSLEGIQSFSNLEILSCWENQLTTLDLSGMSSLYALACNDNQLSNLNLSGCLNLIELFCNNNLLVELDVSGLTNLTQITCNNNLLAELDVSGHTNLEVVYFDNNPTIETFNAAGCTALISYTYHPSLKHVDFSNCISLELIELFTEGNLESLNVSNCQSLSFLFIDQSQLTSLDLSGFTNLISVVCGFSQISDLDIVGCVNLQTLILNSNQLSTIDISSNIALTELDLYNNNLTTLDASSNFNLTYLYCSSNNLESLIIKNGQNENISLSDNPNLEFICADDDQIDAIQNQLNVMGMTTTVVNSYCTFTPGGNYNTISGTVLFDEDQNGCDENDSSQSLIKIKITEGNSTGYMFTNSNGEFNRYVIEGDFELEPIIENDTFFTVTPVTASVSFLNANNNNAIQDFCIVPVPQLNDLEVIIAPVIPARPGFNAVYKIAYKNKGNYPMSQQNGVNLVYNQNLMQLVSTTVAPSSLGQGVIQWDYANLMPFESRSIEVTMAINPPTDPENPVNIDDELVFTSVILPQDGDEMVQDNTFVYNQTVVGSYDPNDITCLQGDVVPPSQIGNYLHYLIRFENTGNAPAENVVVKVEIDPNQFDTNSLQMLSTSHNADIRMSGNKIEFIFQNVQLESGGHGNILLKMKTNETLQIGDYVEKRANIYFDYNFPIETNEAETLFEALSVANPVLDNLISIYPNPTNDIVNITIKDNSILKTIELYDVQGRLLQTQLVNDISSEVSLAERAKGMYFLKINTDKGSKVEKLIKE